MTLPFQNSPFSRIPEDHPQINIIRDHITRAMHDLFLISITSLDDEFLLVFDSEQEISDFCEGMIVYREAKEEYEICSKIIEQKPKLIEKWKKMSKENYSDSFDIIKAWLKSTT